MTLTFSADESHFFPLEYVNRDDVIAIGVYLMNKMRGNHINCQAPKSSSPISFIALTLFKREFYLLFFWR